MMAIAHNYPACSDFGASSMRNPTYQRAASRRRIEDVLRRKHRDAIGWRLETHRERWLPMLSRLENRGKSGGEIAPAAALLSRTEPKDGLSKSGCQWLQVPLKSNRSHRSPIAGELTGTYGLAADAIGFS